MNLEIKYIKNRNEEGERIVFVVKKDCDIGSYLVFLTKQTKPESFNIKYLKHPFWFPDNKVKENDLVILYSKSGTSSQKINKDGTTSYFFYRGIGASIFTDDDHIALLIEADKWAGSQMISK